MLSSSSTKTLGVISTQVYVRQGAVTFTFMPTVIHGTLDANTSPITLPRGTLPTSHSGSLPVTQNTRMYGSNPMYKTFNKMQFAANRHRGPATSAPPYSKQLFSRISLFLTCFVT